MNDPRRALADVFGFTSFRPHQEEIVAAIARGRDVFAVMPTGGGKSLCYQLPAAMAGGTAVVISPLISLMKDQVDAANANGIGAASLNSTLGETERRAIYSAVRGGVIKLLYISPERFNSPGFADYLRTLDISFFAVDEAHCISEWGHDFRPDYLSLSAMTRDFPKTPVAAFTATATPRVSEDIVRRLGLRDPHLTRASFNRPNLTYRILPKERQVERQIAAFIAARGEEPGIVYRTTRKSVDATAAFLRQHGVDARAYHAGLGDNERKDAQESFRHDRCRVVVATVAFGMGIDKPNVRYVVHGDLPKNLEGYYQETGRAGRDGDPAQCLLFHGPADIMQLRRFNEGVTDPVARQAAEEQLRRMAAFARSGRCRRAEILGYFGETYPEDNCGGCDICLGEAETVDATVAAQKALSAMARTGGRFGAGHLADILTGSRTEKVAQRGHDRLPTFGVGKDQPKAYWRRVIQTLVDKGLAAVEEGLYPIPAATEKGWEVMRGERRFTMLKSAEPREEEGGGVLRARRSGAPKLDYDGPYDEKLFDLLRRRRSEVAGENGVPAYVVFPDRALRDMARLYPETEERMLLVSGVGQHKLRQYGGVFMEVIAGYLAEHPDRRPSKAAPAAATREARPAAVAGREAAPPRPALPPGVTATEAATLELLRRGLNAREAARERGLQVGTVLTHMEKLAAAGERFAAEQFMEGERFREIAEYFDKSGGWALRPVVELSGEGVTYDEARLARIFLTRQG